MRGMSGLNALERSEQNRVLNDRAGDRVILVDALLPVSDDIGRFHLANDIGHIAPYSLIIGDFAVLVGSEDRLRANYRVRGKSFPSLLRSIGCRRHFGISAFTQRHLENDDAISPLVLMDEELACGKLHVAGVCADCEDDPG